MTASNPKTELARPFSSEDAQATPWQEALEHLEDAEVFWISTVRPDGRPHVTPLLAVWREHALYFCTGPTEQKALNLEQNRNCILTTGCNTMSDGLDIVVEGEAVAVNDEKLLRSLAAMWQSKYGWEFDVKDGAFLGDGGRALVFEVAPRKAFGFGKGSSFSQTRWRF